MTGKLVLMPMLRAQRLPDGRFAMTKKFLSGLRAFQAAWHDEILVFAEPSTVPSGNLDDVAVDESEFQFFIGNYTLANLRKVASKAAVILGGLGYRQNHAALVFRALGVPFVTTSEYTLRTRHQIASSETDERFALFRRRVWEIQQEQKNRASVLVAAGLQCNGTPTFDGYSKLSRSPMLYFDTRTRESDVLSNEALDNRLKTLSEDRPLRLAFSGRLDPMKGVGLLPEFAKKLRERGVSFQLDICGGGTLEASIRSDIERLGLTDVVKMRGILDFNTELLPFVRESVDLFILPHVQGDPSCTYLETLACGVPIAGFLNEAFAGILTRQSVGWGVPLKDVDGLVSLVERLATNRESIGVRARLGLAFAREHTFESTFARRVEHIRSLARRS